MSSSSLAVDPRLRNFAVADRNLSEQVQYQVLCRRETLHTQEDLKIYADLEKRLLNRETVHFVEYDIYGIARTTVYRTYAHFLFASRLQLAFNSPAIKQNCDPPYFKYRLRPMNNDPRFQVPKERDCCLFDGQQGTLQAARVAWKSSSFCKKLNEFLRNNLIRSTPVKSIVCFGLGRLARHPIMPGHEHRYSGYLRYAAALEIREIYHQPGHPPIPIYVFDPRICSNCLLTLERNHGILACTAITGFQKVNKDTFVITKRPPFAVREIVADLTADDGGPAGILCDPIIDDGSAGIGTQTPDDPSTPNVFKIKNNLRRMPLCDTGDLAGHVFGDVEVYYRLFSGLF